MGLFVKKSRKSIAGLLQNKCFSQQIVMNNNLAQIRAVVFEKNAKIA